MTAQVPPSTSAPPAQRELWRSALQLAQTGNRVAARTAVQCAVRGNRSASCLTFVDATGRLRAPPGGSYRLIDPFVERRALQIAVDALQH